MKRTILGFSLLCIPLFFAACSAGNEPAGEATSDTQSPEMAAASKGSEEARRLAQTLQSRLGLSRSGDLAARGVSVTLSERANGAFHVGEERSNVAIDVGLLGATDAAREDVEGFAVYRAGHESGAHIVLRSGSNGAEDYLVFEKNLPKEPVLRYEVKLGDAIAGLRLVSRTLEFLDKAGTPQLRMAPPYAVDGDGKRIKLSVAVEECAVDTSPLGPWRRPTVAPGRDHCIVRLEWEGAVKAPLIVDPVWIATEDLIEPRTNTAAAVLPNGLVLAAGGDWGTFGTEMDSAELYDPATNKWSPTNSMNNARSRHSATAVQIDGAGGVFVAGGKVVTNGQAVYPLTTEFYNAATGEWSDKGVMTSARYDHVATRLADGRVLLSGGNSTGSTLGKCEVFDSGISAGPITMARARVHHTATLTTLGKVLLVGGEGAADSPTTAETWDPVQAPSGPFTIVNPLMPVPRPGGHAAVALPMGRVLVVGGYPMMAGLPPPGADVWTPGNMMPWTPTQPMQKNRAGLTLTALSPARYLAVGGSLGGDPPAPLPNVEVFDALAAIQWSSTQQLIAPRVGHVAVGLPGGQVLVIGGQQFPLANGVPNAEIFAACDSNEDCASGEYCSAEGGCLPKKAAGEPCNIEGECKDPSGCAQAVCASGHCADGVCCDTDCTGQCEACNGVLPGKCTAVIGNPVIGTLPVRMGCHTDGSICGGKCGGANREACENFPIGNQCKVSCKVDTLQTYTCNGMGDCNVMTETTCGAYLCNKEETSCQTSCQKEGNSCGEAYTCNDNGACVALPTKCSPDKPNEMLSETNEPISCGDYICRSSACLTACESAYDCYSETEPMVCTEGGVCKPFSEVKNEPSSGACGCSVPGDKTPVRARWLLMLAASSMLLRRRRTSRPRA